MSEDIIVIIIQAPFFLFFLLAAIGSWINFEKFCREYRKQLIKKLKNHGHI